MILKSKKVRGITDKSNTDASIAAALKSNLFDITPNHELFLPFDFVN